MPSAAVEVKLSMPAELYKWMMPTPGMDEVIPRNVGNACRAVQTIELSPSDAEIQMPAVWSRPQPRSKQAGSSVIQTVEIEPSRNSAGLILQSLQNGQTLQLTSQCSSCKHGIPLVPMFKPNMINFVTVAKV